MPRMLLAMLMLSGAAAAADRGSLPAAARRGWLIAGGAAAAATVAAVVLGLRNRRAARRVRFAAVIRLPPTADGPPQGSVLGGRFIVERALDRGSWGQVFEGRDLEDRPVLIARYCPTVPPRRGFDLQKARAACSLKHEGLVALEAAFEDNGWGVAVRAAHEGELLSSILEKAPGRRLAADVVLAAAAPVCAALDAAHAAGLIHGAIETRRLMMSGGAWRLSGLGLPEVLAADAGPPEGSSESREADVYLLASCLYEAIAGAKPFSGLEGAQARREGRLPPLAGRPGLPPGLDVFFARALQPDCARRFHGAGEMLLALRSVVASAVH